MRWIRFNKDRFVNLAQISEAELTEDDKGELRLYLYLAGAYTVNDDPMPIVVLEQDDIKRILKYLDTD